MVENWFSTAAMAFKNRVQKYYFFLKYKLFPKKIKKRLSAKHRVAQYEADIGAPIQVEVLVAVETDFPEARIEAGIHRNALAEGQLRPYHARHAKTGAAVIGLVLGHPRHIRSTSIHIKQGEFAIFYHRIETLDFHKVKLRSKFNKRLKYLIELESVASRKIKKRAVLLPIKKIAQKLGTVKIARDTVVIFHIEQ